MAVGTGLAVAGLLLPTAVGVAGAQAPPPGPGTEPVDVVGEPAALAGAQVPAAEPLDVAADPAVDALVARGAALRATRAELIARIARLSDEAEAAQARLVAAQRRAAVVADAVADARASFVEHAVQAFVHAGPLPEGARARGSLYAGVVGDVDRSVQDAVAEAEAESEIEHAAAGEALEGARRSATEVEVARSELEATITGNDASTEVAVTEAARSALARRVAEEQARAREATARAEAEQRDAERRAAEQAAADLAAIPPPDVGRTPLDAGAGPPPRTSADRTTGRVARATAAQAALMAAHRFGPVPGLPPGVVATGQVVDGLASWYGPGFDGRTTASGAVYDQEGWTVASKELPLGTVLLVTRGARSVLVLVNDRGPFVAGRVLDLSHAVASALGTVGPGVAQVRAEVVRLP